MTIRTITNKPIDTQVYEEELCPWLPERIFDCHVHIGIPEHCGPISDERTKSDWAMEVGVQQSWEDWHEAVRVLFPRQHISALVMGVPFREMHLDRNNDYVISGITDPGTKALFVTRPEWEPDEIDRAFDRGFVGIKPYPVFAPSLGREPSIFDFLPSEHLQVVNSRSGVLMLHLPRAGRIADPDNIRELRKISQRYSSIRVVVAHIGRAFCFPTALAGIPSLVDCPNLWFDTAAHLNPDVFALALELLGPERIIYGSDLPITLMRGVREHVGEKYINFTDGDYSWNTNRKPPEVEANYTYFLYEEIRAIRDAIKRTGLGRDAIDRIMYSNAASLLSI